MENWKPAKYPLRASRSFDLEHRMRSRPIEPYLSIICSLIDSSLEQGRRGVQVHLERFITGTQRKNDIRTTGSAPSGLSSEDIDFTIVSLASQASKTAALHLEATEDSSMVERTAKVVEKHLNAVAREKRRRHPSSDRPFRPLVLSIGGMRETEARDDLKLWKSIMTGGVHSRLVRKLSLGLLRARARCFEP
ncbi:hypothetical protein EHS25_000958 [Saitozyma podzolica]|uniref:Uncharacterized protein n=1 Tax=Saitozyma podzolica TaxID=1890683 RepID=A0A427YXQ7_9TREE|nr:hypothetical protein EHS25_000958 [Saitozyma podzolica]